MPLKYGPRLVWFRLLFFPFFFQRILFLCMILLTQIPVEASYPDSLITISASTTANQLQSVTDSLGHVVFYTWDDLDRLETVNHPDGSTETLGYGGRLFPETHIDRLGRLTQWDYNDAGQLVEQISYGIPTEAALQGVGALKTRYEWCDCGSVSAIIDPAGNRTSWEYDLLGRVISETDAAGRQTLYEYGPRLGRLSAVTRPDGVATTYGYTPGGDLAKLDFSDGTTPGLRYDYHPDHGWLTTVSSVTPGTETVLESVTYQHTPYTTDATTAPLGAGRLQIETGVLANSRVFFDYDNKGRVERRRQLNDSGGQLQVSNWTYDALNRLSVMSDPVAYQEFDYDGVSSRLLERWMYNSVVPATPIYMYEDYGYQTPAQGGRLSAMSRRIGAGGTPFTTYGYGYQDNDQLNSISLARTGLPDQSQVFQYDSQLRLRDVGLTENGQPNGSYQYLSDKAGNLVTAISPSQTKHWQADATNQLQSQTGLGPRRIVGTVDEPSHVKVNGDFVPVDENLRFEAVVDTLQTRNVEIEATDFTGNVTTNSYWFAEPDNTAGAVLRHDANGRLVEKEEAEQTTTYTWDALDRLLKVEQMSLDGSDGLRRIYGYDPLGRLVTIETESWDGSAWIASTPNYRYVYAGLDRLQKRTLDNTGIYRYYYPDGIQTGGGNYYFYGRDNLGSITELIEVPTGNVVSRREYSPYGEVTSESGTVKIDHGFTGHFYDEVFQLHHAPARVYDASLGRWLTPDPLPGAQGLPEGTNLYAYVGNDPINYTDPYGWCRQSGNDRGRRGDGAGGGKGPPRRIANSASPSPGDPGNGDGLNGLIPLKNNSVRKLLQSRGATKQQAQQIVNSFEGQIYARHGTIGDIFTITETSRGSASGLFVSRGSAGANPAARVRNLALPSSNRALVESQGYLTRPQILLEGRVGSQVGNPGFGPTARGGAWQVITDAFNGGLGRH